MGPSTIQIEHRRVRAALAVAIITLAFAVLASHAPAASARAIDAPGLPTPNVSSSEHSAPAPPASDGTSVMTIAGLCVAGIVLVVGGVLVLDAVTDRVVLRARR